MKEKILLDFKNEVAKKYNNSDGSECTWDDLERKLGPHKLIKDLEEAAQNHANHLKAIALQATIHKIISRKAT